MIAVARYLLAAQVRARTLVAPGAVMAIGVIFIYSVAPNPVLATGGGVAAFLFFVQLWLALAFFNSQTPADRHIAAAAVGAGRFARGRLLAGAGLATLAAVAAVAYPVVAGRFEHPPGVAELGLCAVASLAATTAGTGLAALFAEPLVRNRAIATLGLAVCALLTIPLGPPAASIAHAMNTEHAAGVPARLAGGLATIGVFTITVVIACSTLWPRTE